MNLVSKCKSSATIKNFQNQFDENLSDVQEIFFEASDGKIFSFLVKGENAGEFFGEYGILKKSQIPKVGEKIFFTKYFENQKIIRFITEKEFFSSEIKNCDEENFGIFFGISLGMVIIMFFFQIFLHKKKSPH